MILVDASVWIDYFRGTDNAQTGKLDYVLDKSLVAVGDITLAEVLQGFRKEQDYRIAKKLLLSLACLTICDKNIALKSAANFRQLRKRGITVRKTIDMLIGTYCIENEIVLLHNDRDFDPLEKHLGLRVL